MKKEKQISPVKAAKKKIKENIQLRLSKVMRTIATELANDDFNIDKASKKLTKQLTKSLKIPKFKEKVVAAPKPAIKDGIPLSVPVNKSVAQKPAKTITKAKPVKGTTRKQSATAKTIKS